jgi:hypothetical protein
VLLQNACHIPEADLYLRSVNVHDFIQWRSEDGRVDYAIDGGHGRGAYVRRVGHDNGRVFDWCLYDDDPFDLIAERLLWGTFGKEGKEPRRWRPISTLELGHLQAILQTQSHIKGTLTERVVQHWATQKGQP